MHIFIRFLTYAKIFAFLHKKFTFFTPKILLFLHKKFTFFTPKILLFWTQILLQIFTKEFVSDFKVFVRKVFGSTEKDGALLAVDCFPACFNA